MNVTSVSQSAADNQIIIDREAIRRLVELGLKVKKRVIRGLRGHLKKTGCYDRWGRLAKAPPRLRRCSGANRRACTSELTCSRSSWPVRRQGRSRSGNERPTGRPDHRRGCAVNDKLGSFWICLLKKARGNDNQGSGHSRCYLLFSKCLR